LQEVQAIMSTYLFTHCDLDTFFADKKADLHYQ